MEKTIEEIIEYLKYQKDFYERALALETELTYEIIYKERIKAYQELLYYIEYEGW